MARKAASARNDNAADDELEAAPLFAEAGSEIAWIGVTREDPEEGYVGRLAPHATERDIAKKYGGGTFSLSARNQHGKPVKGGHRTVSIAGDPVWQSRTAELKWRRQMGLDEGKAAAAAPNEKPVGLMELMLLMDKQSQRAREEAREIAAERERQAQISHERQMALMAEDSKRREMELRLERERLDREAADREARRATEAKEERERNREFMGTMLQLVKSDAKQSGADPVQLLMKGIELAQALKGGGDGDGDGDPLASLAANLPAILEQGSKLVERGTAPRPAPAARRKPKEDDDEDGVTLQGEIATKAKALVKKLEAEGKDPAAVMSRAMDVLLGQRRAGKPARAAAPAPAAKPGKKRSGKPARPAAAAPSKVRPPAKAATVKK